MSVVRNGETYVTVEEMFKKIDTYWKNLPIFWKIAFKIRNYCNNHKKEPYWFFQRIFKGYSDLDMWNFDHFMAKKIYKYLKLFKRYNNAGYCGDFPSHEEWHKAIDKMIWSMEQTAKDFPGEEHSFKNDTYIKYIEKIREGNELFGKYFNSLWD